MKAANRGLGKGLSALLSDSYSTSMDKADKDRENVAPAGHTQGTLPVEKLRSGKFQPRQHFADEQLEELSQSIQKNGIMQPIIVRPLSGGNYEIIAGERRWRAAKMAGLGDVPVLIRDISDQTALELALVENIQRQDLSPLEEATGYQRLMDEFSYTQEELGTAVGKSRSHIANLLRLLDLPAPIQRFLEEGKLSVGHARTLLNVKGALELAEEIIRRGLNVRQTEKFIREAQQGPKPQNGKQSVNRGGSGGHSSGNHTKDPDILALEETLSENLGLKVSIDDRGQNGEITIVYSSLEQLDEILRRLGGSI